MMDVSRRTRKVTNVKLPRSVNSLNPVRYCFSAVISLIELGMSGDSRVSSDLCDIGFNSDEGTVVLERR